MLRQFLVTSLILLLTCFSVVRIGLARSSNFNECILENMEGVNNEYAAKLIARACAGEFPDSVPSDFDHLYGDYGFLEGFIYGMDSYSDPLPLPGVRIRLLDVEVVARLAEHFALWKTAHDMAIANELEQLRKDIFADLNLFREEQEFQIKETETQLQNLRAVRSELFVARENLTVQLRAFENVGQEEISSLEQLAETAEINDANSLNEARDKLASIETVLAEKHKELAESQEDSDREFEAKREELLELKRSRKEDLENLHATIIGDKAAIESEVDKKISEAEGRLEELNQGVAAAESELAKSRREHAIMLRNNYLNQHIKVETFYDEHDVYGRSGPCLLIRNTGEKLAIRSLAISLKFKGVTADELGVNVNDISSVSFSGYTGTDSWSVFDHSLTPILINTYEEEIHGIGPKKSWPVEGNCVDFYEFSVKGDIQRAFEKVGGFNVSEWTFYLRNVDLVRQDMIGATPDEYNSSLKVWTYPSQSTVDLFREEVDAAEAGWPFAERKQQLVEELETIKLDIKRFSEQKAAEISEYEDKVSSVILAAQAKVTEAETKSSELKRLIIGAEVLLELEAEKRAFEEDLEELQEQIEERQSEIKSQITALKVKSGVILQKIEEAKEEIEHIETDIQQAKELLEQYRSESLEAEEAWASIESGSGQYYLELVSHVSERVILEQSFTQDWMDTLQEVLETVSSVEARSDLNGAYEFNDISLGKYIAYGLHEYDGEVTMWLQPIQIKRKTKLELGPFNAIVDPEYQVPKVAESLKALLPQHDG